MAAKPQNQSTEGRDAEDFDFPATYGPGPAAAPAVPIQDAARAPRLAIARPDFGLRDGARPQPPARGIPSEKLAGHLPEWAHRGALFAAIRTGHGGVRPSTAVKTACEAAILHSGPVLSMGDKEVWSALLDLAKAQRIRLGEPFDAPLRTLAKRMGCSSLGGPQCGRIADSLRRLSESALSIQGPAGSAEGPMVASLDLSGPRARVVLAPALTELALGTGRQFKVDAARRRSLSRPLARWLHDFVSTHSKASDHDLLYLREMSGFQGGAGAFAEALREALAELAGLGDPNPLIVDPRIGQPNPRGSDSWTLAYVRGAERAAFSKAKLCKR